MKNYSLPLLEPEFVCEPCLSFANAVVRANVGDDVRRLTIAQHLNCYYDKNSLENKFVISVFDHWCVQHKVMQYQSFNLLKETIKKQNISIKALIKESLLLDCYVLGSCNRNCFEKVASNLDQVCDFLVFGFDDTQGCFSVCFINISNQFVVAKILFEDFITALFDTNDSNIFLTFRRYNRDYVKSLDLNNLVREIKNYLNSTNDRKNYSMEKVYGISAVQEMALFCVDNSCENKMMAKTCLEKLLLHKKYMVNRMEYLAEQKIISHRWIDKAERIQKNAHQIFALWSEYSIAPNLKLAEQLSKLIDQIILLELDYLPKVLDEISSKVEL